ncbi:MAG: polyprenyl synthetase family protein [Gemmatimonadales bacterium]|nr:polyprenyl synthetase family protein [Gemmatimonadales bacterium]
MSDAVTPTLLDAARQMVEGELAACASRMQREAESPLAEALAYALVGPGKRVRPALVLGAYQVAGGTAADIAGIATAVEIVHTYSLVHDDLPCMDNDHLRRGRQTTHRRFDVHTATRVGFLLVPVAAEVLATSARALGLDAASCGRLAEELFEAGGIRGMVGGQWLDLEAEATALDLDQLTRVHAGKTGALIRASVMLGGIAAGADATTFDALSTFGREIGIAFQVADDVLDATSTSEVLGKTAGLDAALDKSTYVSLLGVDGARQEALRHHDLAVRALAPLGAAATPLADLARYIVMRRS